MILILPNLICAALRTPHGDKSLLGKTIYLPRSFPHVSNHFLCAFHLLKHWQFNELCNRQKHPLFTPALFFFFLVILKNFHSKSEVLQPGTRTKAKFVFVSHLFNFVSGVFAFTKISDIYQAAPAEKWLWNKKK